MRPTRGRAVAVGLALAVPLVLSVAPSARVATPAAASTSTPPSCGARGGSADFNSDGYADLAIGVRGENGAVGGVDIAYGGPSGPSSGATGNQHWNLDTAGVAGTDQAGAGLGWALTAGDFNGDGYDDLAVGAPLATVGSATRAGEVLVLLGSSKGLTATGSTLFTQNTSGITDVAETDDEFGHALGAGDFNADGYDDLAIGVPGENSNAGAVEVILGSADGLTTTGNKLWSQDTTENGVDMKSAAESGDLFGWSLATGRFGSDRYTDLVVGVPHEDGLAADEGAVHFIAGSADGLTTAGNYLWTEEPSDVPGDAETGDSLGWSVAAGDFNGDRYCDLAAGVPDESVVTSSGTTLSSAGAVLVLYSTSSGLSTTGTAPQYWTRNHDNVDGAPRAYASFGWSLAAGDINGDGRDDLAIGAPFDEVSGNFDAGDVSVLFGAGAMGLWPLDGVPDELWSEDTAVSGGEVNGTAGAADEFGYSLAMGNFNGDPSNKDLAIGVPGANSSKGAVAVIYEWNNKLEIEPVGYDDTRMTRTGTVFGTAQTGDRFGESLS